MEERLQKILARAGFGSRRACETLITARRVIVNGQVASIGSKADPLVDHILVDGRPIKAAEALQYVALHKPRGVLSAVEAPDPRPTVRDLVDLPGTLYPVGRLDIESEGLILLTNDGELANRLTHPRYGHEKEYRVLLTRRPDEQQLEAWRHGVVLEDGQRTAPAEVNLEGQAGEGAWLRVVMREGRKRQIRETAGRIGLRVQRIIRVRIGTLLLGNLKPRQWRVLTAQEVEALKSAPGTRKPARKAYHPPESARASRTGGERPPRSTRPGGQAKDKAPHPGQRSARITNERTPRRPAPKKPTPPRPR